jgi:hypothetical protein
MAEQTVIRETLSVVTKNITPEDRALSAGFSALARQVLARASAVVEFGPPRERDVVMRAVLGNLGKMAAVDSRTEIEVSRAELLETMGRMTAIEGHLSDADAKALAGLAYDQDDEPEGSAV